MMDGMMGGWMMLWGVLGVLLLLGLVVVIVLAIVRMARPRSGTSSEFTDPAEPPLEILQRRLARGEITPEQFEAMKHQIQEKER